MQQNEKRHKREEYDRKAKQHLDAVADRYFFDESSGFYKPKASEAKSDGHKKKPGDDKHLPLWAAIKTDWLVVTISGLTLLLLLATVILARRQWKAIDKQYPEIKKSADAAKKSADTARFSLESVQRAFIVSPQGTINSVGSGPTQIFTYKLQWKNVGYTPAVSVVSHESFAQMAALPRNFSFPDKWSDDEERLYATIPIGPQGITYDIAGPIPRGDVEKLSTTRTPIYFWGWARYRDIFDDTITHLTEVCTKLVGFYGSPLINDPRENIEPVMLACPTHNCTDRDCPDYEKMIEKNLQQH
jgi:hypothetical protein